MTSREVTLLRDFITWQSLPFVDNVFSTRDETIKHFNEWLIQVSGNQQPSEDYISRQAVLDYAKDTCLDLDKYEDTEIFCDEIKAMPSITPQRPKGKWIYEMQTMNNPYTYKCSVCKGWEKDKTKYCPNCGSYNGGGEDEVGHD